MPLSPSKLATSRQNGLHQVEAQRIAILDAAEQLFLRDGIDRTTMSNIATQVGITRVSLYRYYPSRDVIAVEIHKRMLKRIAATVPLEAWEVSLEAAMKITRAMIHHFDTLRDAYRYMGMFDSLYLDYPSGTNLAEWTKDQLIALFWNGISLEDISGQPDQGNRFMMVLSTVIWFLEKLALRGELTWSDQSVPLQVHLDLFEDMIMGYIDQDLE